MVIKTWAPARVSLGSGGDTDYYLKEIGWGCIVNTTLSSVGTEVTLIEDGHYRVIYSDNFRGIKLDDSFRNLELDGGKHDLTKATLSYIDPNYKGSFRINTNVPRESGLGGSSTYNVALVLALLKGQNKLINPEELAQAAFHIERNIMGVPGGYQDQWAAAYGRGLNYMVFKDGKVEVHPVKITLDNLRKLEENSLLVYFAKRESTGTQIHEDQKIMLEQNPGLLRQIMLEKRDNATKVKEALESGDFITYAECVNRDWDLKQKLSAKIGDRDNIYQTAMANGALAGRVCGAGGGGTYYFFCEDGKKQQVLDSIRDKVIGELPFRIQRSTEIGAQYLV